MSRKFLTLALPGVFSSSPFPPWTSLVFFPNSKRLSSSKMLRWWKENGHWSTHSTEVFWVLVPVVSSDLTFCGSVLFSGHGNCSLACLWSCLSQTYNTANISGVWPYLFVLGNPALFFFPHLPNLQDLCLVLKKYFFIFVLAQCSPLRLLVTKAGVQLRTHSCSSWVPEHGPEWEGQGVGQKGRHRGLSQKEGWCHKDHLCTILGFS